MDVIKKIFCEGGGWDDFSNIIGLVKQAHTNEYNCN